MLKKQDYKKSVGKATVCFYLIQHLGIQKLNSPLYFQKNSLCYL